MPYTLLETIHKRRINWATLKYELTIPKDDQLMYYSISGRRIPVGARHEIKLIIDGEEFKAHFRNEGFNRNKFDHSDILMLSYGADARKKLQAIFADTFARMEKVKDSLPPRGRMPLFDDVKEYVVLSATTDPDVFVLDCVSNTEMNAVANDLGNVTEAVFELDDIAETDATAGYIYSAALRKVRRLDKSICKGLKKLYNNTCQMTGEKVGSSYDTTAVEAHHLIPFTESQNNDRKNIIILSPNYHRIVHNAQAIWLPEEKAFRFPNGLVEVVKLNKHL